MLSLQECRELLGESARDLTDDQVLETRNALYAMVEPILDEYIKNPSTFMKPLLTFKTEISEEYPIRLVAKAVILDDQNNVLLFNNYLPGGGVEEGETLEEGLKRECMEEVGAEIEITKELGVVIQYRDYLQKKYEIHGFLARLISRQVPTTSQEDEVGQKISFLSILEAKEMLKTRIQEMENSETPRDSEEFQSRYYHRKTTLAFIEEVLKEFLDVNLK